MDSIDRRAFVERLAGAGAVAAAGAIGAVRPAHAQSPKPLTLVVNAAPGGAVDPIARVFAAAYTAKTGRNVVIENRAGAGGYVGAEAVARAAPDGNTLLMTPYLLLFSHIFVKNQAVNLVQALTAIATIAETPYSLFASAELGVRDFRQFLALARQQPGKLNAGVLGSSGQMLDSLLMMKAAGIELTNVPFNGSAAVMLALARNDVQVYLGSYASGKAQVDAGRAVLLGVAGKQRWAILPDVPTIREQGVDFAAASVFGIVGPTGMPRETVESLNATFNEIFQSAAMQESLRRIGLTVPPPTDAAQTERWFLDEGKRLEAAAATLPPER